MRAYGMEYFFDGERGIEQVHNGDAEALCMEATAKNIVSAIEAGELTLGGAVEIS